MIRFKKIVIFFTLFVILALPARAMDLIDIYFGLQTWSMRFGGYRNYRIPVKLASGESCVVALTAHVNPKVEHFTILLHGFGDSRFSWWKWIEKYQDHPVYSSFIAIDWPQHGQTDCSSVDSWPEIVQVIRASLLGFQRQVGTRPVYRIIGQSLGMVPAALLAEHYPKAQQVWLTPPLLKPAALKALLVELLAIDSPVQVQIFMNRVLTKNRELPEMLRKEMLDRIRNAQRVLKNTSVPQMDAQIFGRRYNNLLIVTGSGDQLLPPSELDPRMARLSPRLVEAVPCGHDILRYCGEDVKTLVEGARYRPVRSADSP